MGIRLPIGNMTSFVVYNLHVVWFDTYVTDSHCSESQIYGSVHVLHKPLFIKAFPSSIKSAEKSSSPRNF